MFACIVTLAATTATFGEEAKTPPPSPPASDKPIIIREEAIETKVGEKRRIPTDRKILDVTATRPEVADAFLSTDQELILNANSPGVAKVVVQLDNGSTIAFEVRVYVADPEEFMKKLKSEIGGIQGINIEVVKGKILVEGRVLYLKDMDAIERAVDDNPSIINLTSLSSRNAHILSREIQRELRESGIYGAKVEVRNNRVTLVGTLASEILVKKAEHIASTYTPTFDSLLKVGPASKENQPKSN